MTAFLHRYLRVMTTLLAFALLVGQPCRAQQNPDGIMPLHTTNQPYLFLVRDPVVHEDLKLTDEQLERLTKVNDKVDMSMWSMRNKGPQLVKIMAESTSTTKKALREILTKKQNRRIAQIELWVLGLKSLLRDNVAKHLKLEPEQRSDARRVIETAQQGMAELRQQLNAGGDAKELNSQFRDLQVKQQEDILEIITPEQRQAYAALLGEQMDTSKLGRIKFKAPEFDKKSAWVNSTPLTMASLKGKVVALHFYAFH